MQKRTSRWLQFFLAIWAGNTLLLAGCTALNQQPDEPPATSTAATNHGEFAIYLASQTTPVAEGADHVLCGVERGDLRLVSVDDIVSYQQETHHIQLTEEAFERILHLHVPVQGLPFLVCVGHTPIYDGMFWTMLSSFRPSDGLMIVQPFNEQKRTIQIEPFFSPPGTTLDHDPRADPRIMHALQQAGVLR